MVAEIIMIVIDNSEYVRKDSVFFRIQLEAIRLYCRAKIKSNPDNRVGLGFMTSDSFGCPIEPTSDIEHFLTHTIENVSFGGELSFLGGLQYSTLGFVTKRPTNMKKRMLVFAGGPDPEYLLDDIRRVGQGYNECDIAVDVVSFACDNRAWDISKTECLRQLVALADKDNNNSHFAHVPAHVTPDSSSVRDILVSSMILSPSEADAALSVEEVVKKKKKKKKKLRRHKKKKDHHSQEVREEEHVSSEDEATVRSPRASFPDSVLASLKDYDHVLELERSRCNKEKKGVGCSTSAA